MKHIRIALTLAALATPALASGAILLCCAIGLAIGLAMVASVILDDSERGSVPEVADDPWMAPTPVLRPPWPEIHAKARIAMLRAGMAAYRRSYEDGQAWARSARATYGHPGLRW